jgi:DNA repair protein RadD
VSKVINNEHRLQPPEIVIARKIGRFWKVTDKLFNLKEFPKAQALLAEHEAKHESEY